MSRTGQDRQQFSIWKSRGDARSKNEKAGSVIGQVKDSGNDWQEQVFHWLLNETRAAVPIATEPGHAKRVR